MTVLKKLLFTAGIFSVGLYPAVSSAFFTQYSVMPGDGTLSAATFGVNTTVTSVYARFVAAGNRIDEFHLFICKNASPVDNLVFELRKPTRGLADMGTLVSSSTTVVSGASLSACGASYAATTTVEFGSAGVEIEEGEQYFLWVYRTGAVNATNNYSFQNEQVPSGVATVLVVGRISAALVWAAPAAVSNGGIVYYDFCNVVVESGGEGGQCDMSSTTAAVETAGNNIVFGIALILFFALFLVIFRAFTFYA